jgi:uncharacterized membrane protein
MQKSDKSQISNFISFSLLFSFILLVFINAFSFLDPEYSDILGDPSREANQFSYDYFFAGFLVLWLLVSLILFWYLWSKIRATKNKSLRKLIDNGRNFFYEIKNYLIGDQPHRSTPTPKFLAWGLEKFLILLSIIVCLMAYILYFLRIFDLTQSSSHTILIVFLIILVPILLAILNHRSD